MTPSDVKVALFQVLSLALIASKMTRSKFDDKLVELLLNIASDDVLFGQFLELIGKSEKK